MSLLKRLKQHGALVDNIKSIRAKITFSSQNIEVSLQFNTIYIPINTIIYATALSSDNNIERAIWDWGDESSSDGVIDTEILGNHIYSEAMFTVLFSQRPC